MKRRHSPISTLRVLPAATLSSVRGGRTASSSFVGDDLGDSIRTFVGDDLGDS